MTTGVAASRKRPVAGIGRVIGWPGGSAWIGRFLGPIQDHAHHAIQISLAMEGRFRHLFVAQTGTSLRAWLLWARVDHAMASAFHGQSWTEAAHAAGFADAAHLTRTCRRVFGIAPSMLVPEQLQ